MVSYAKLLEQGVPLEEITERAKDDVQLEQEIIWSKLTHLEPLNDHLPRMDMFPGHNEYRGRGHKSYHHGSGSAMSRREKDKGSGHTFRPWRDLANFWPEHGIVVEIQIRGSNSATGRIPKAFHRNKIWYYADTGKRITSIVERWRMMIISK